MQHSARSAEILRRQAFALRRPALPQDDGVGWDDSVGQVYNVNGGGQECPACIFLVDLALRYFVSYLYNLNGFMKPLRTGIVRGGFLCLGHCRARKCRSLGFARDDNLLEDDSFFVVTEFRG